ncbi:MAG: nitrogen regulation protein NR(I) [Alphaproteobacteria bacterium]|nr:nitrogen regulation protein NR(I) [Alphaproteobacteria bacterium]
MSINASILVADDDTAIRTVLTQALSRLGYQVKSVGTAAGLWKWIESGEGDLVITDVVMPDENGLELLPKIKQLRPHLKIIVMSARNTLMTAVQANERGAFEYLAKPFDLNALKLIVEKALESGPDNERGYLHTEPKVLDDEPMDLIGRSPPMQEIYRIMARVMGTELTVAITGESGTGKELIARALHNYGKRRNGPFVALNMAAIPKELIESELFGHERGAFTGATHRSIGRFKEAQNGTLFLDEIGDMPSEAQTRLLRVLQDGEYSMVGGAKTIKSNVRIITATHRDLRQLIRQGLFREDLFYRLNVVPIRVPPLRNRSSDIPDLVHHFGNQIVDIGLPKKIIDADGMRILEDYSWPGNIRELENLVKRISALYAEKIITAETIKKELFEVNSEKNQAGSESSESLSESIERHLREYFNAHKDGLPLPGLYSRILRELERPLIAVTLEATHGNQLRTADLLGLNRNTLRKKISDLDIPVKKKTH